MDPSSPGTLLLPPRIQGHSGGKHIDPTLQDIVSLPNVFAEHIYHDGSSHDLHSIIKSGLIPGGKMTRTCGVLHNRESDVRRSAQRSRVRPDEAGIAVYKNNWKIHKNTEYRCMLRVVQGKRCQFYRTRSNVSIS